MDGAARLAVDIDPSGARSGGSAAQAAIDAMKSSASAADTEFQKLQARINSATSDIVRMSDQVRTTDGALDKFGNRVDDVGNKMGAHGKSARSSTLATMEFDHVIRAMSDSLAAGADPMQALRMEMGRIVEATSFMGAAGGGFAKFMMGPWGIAIQIGAAVLVPLIAEMFTAKEAFGKLEIGAYAVATAQGALGDMFDTSTGKLTRNTAALYLNATAQAINLAAAAAAHRESSNKAFETVGTPGFKQYALGYGATAAAAAGDAFMLPGTEKLGQYADRQLGGNSDVQSLMDRYVKTDTIADKNARAKAQGQIMLQAYGTKDWTGSGTTQKEFIQAIADRQQAQSETDAAADIMSSLRGGHLTKSLIDPTKAKKPKKPKDPNPLEEFGLQAQSTIDDVFSKYDDTPTGVAAAQKQIESLDALMKKLQDRKPPGFKNMVAEAMQAEQVIRNGISKPFDDFLKAQHDSFAVLQLQVAGHQDDADALKTILGLQKSMGPLTEAQKDAVLDTVQAMKAEQRQLEINQARIKINTDALDGIKSAVMDATQAWERGDLGQIVKTPGKILQAFETMKGNEIFDKMFSGMFTKLKDQATGTDIVKNASEKMGAAMDEMTPKIVRTSKAHVDMTSGLDTATTSLTKFTAALDGATGAAGGSVAAGGAGGDATDFSNWKMGQASPLLNQPDLVGSVSALDSLNNSKGIQDSFKDVARALDDNSDIVVTGQREKKNPLLGGNELFAKALGGVGESVAGLFTNGPNAKAFGDAFGKNAGKALGGAATGGIVSGISNSLGIKMNGTGAQLGGAAGAFLPIPGGSIIGSIVGGLLGGLFSSPKYGTASLTGNTSHATTSGNSSATSAAAGGNASSVQTGLSSIASQLGATVGGYSLAIGTFNGKYRVNDYATSASLNANNFQMGGSLHDFGSDEGAALTYAISQAIKQGAIQGLSATENRILSNESQSQSIDQAVADAKTFKAVQDQYAQMTDPLNFGLKTLNDQFSSLKTIMDANSASTAEYANAEAVYQQQRQALIANGNDGALKSMRDYIFQLTGGTSSPLAPEQRYTTAKAQLDADDAIKASGGTVSFDDYKSAADAFLAASRDSQGSGLGYFADLARVTSSVGTMIDNTTKNITVPALDLAPVTTAVNDQTDALASILNSIDGNIAYLAGSSSTVAGSSAAVSLASIRYVGAN